jgi:hypothetical protein
MKSEKIRGLQEYDMGALSPQSALFASSGPIVVIVHRCQLRTLKTCAYRARLPGGATVIILLSSFCYLAAASN